MKNNKGVTLVTLVITVAVILILGMVSINTITDDEGIVNKSQNLEEKVEKTQKDYMKELKDMETELNNVMDPQK